MLFNGGGLLEKINTKIWLKIDIEELEERKEFAMVLPPVSVVANTIGQKVACGGGACGSGFACAFYGTPCGSFSSCSVLSGWVGGGSCPGYSVLLQ